MSSTDREPQLERVDSPPDIIDVKGEENHQKMRDGTGRALLGNLACADIFARAGEVDSVHYSLPSVNMDTYENNVPPELREFLKIEMVVHRAMYPRLPEDSETVIDLQALLDEILETVGIAKGSLRVCVEKSDLPNASINYVGREVRISSSLLEALDYDTNIIVGVLAHEVGHLLMRSYDPISNSPDIIDTKIRRFEEEYQADRIAIIIMSRMGFDPTNFSDFFPLFEDYLEEKQKQEGKYNSGVAKKLELWLASTHPHSSRRIRAISSLSRYLQIKEGRIDNSEIGFDIDDEYLPPRYSENSSSLSQYSSRPKYLKTGSNTDELITPYRDDGGTKRMEKLANTPCIKIESFLDYDADIDEYTFSDWPEFSEETGQDKIHDWWLKAMQCTQDSEYFEDDILGGLEELSTDALELILVNAPTYELLPKFSSFINDQLSLSKEYNVKGLERDCLTGNELRHLPTSYILIATAVFERWIDAKFGDSRTFEDLEVLVNLLKDSRQINGCFLPTQHFHVVEFVRQVFENADDDMKPTVAKFLAENQKYIYRGSGELSFWLRNYNNNIHSHPSYLQNLQNDRKFEDMDFDKQVWEMNVHMLIREGGVFLAVKKGYDEISACKEEDGQISIFIPMQFRNRLNPNSEEPVREFLENSPIFSDLNSAAKEYLVGQIGKKCSKGDPSHYPECFFEIKANMNTWLVLSQDNDIHVSIGENGPVYVEIPVLNREICSKDVIRILRKDPVFASFPKEAKKEICTTIRREFDTFVEPFGDDGRTLLNELQSKIPLHCRYSSKRMKMGNAQKAINEGDDYERALDQNPERMAVYLSPEEFEEHFFGAGRSEYEKAKYASLEETGSYMDMLNLWQQSGAYVDLSKIEGEINKINYISNTFRMSCLLRDQLICRVIGWSSLEYMDDVEEVQSAIFCQNDPRIVLLLADTFFNSFIKLTCCQRAWQLSEMTTPADFLASIDSSILSRTNQLLEGVNDSLITDKLKCIITCFPFPSSRRDELLRPYINQAPDEKSTIIISSLLTEPPPGDTTPKGTESVAYGETSLDFLKRLNRLDREEILLYLLGHRIFYSGINPIDQEREDVSDFIEINQVAALYRHDFLSSVDEESHPYHMDDEGGIGDEEYKKLQISKKYIVECPDSLVMATKFAGIPLSTLFRKERMVTTEREQIDLLYNLMLDDNGILNGPNAENFLQKAAEIIVESGFTNNESKEYKKKISDLLAHIFLNCAEEKLPELFLHAWQIKEDGIETLPQLVAILMQKYGPVFVKAGQYLATQTATLPPEWIEAFRGMNDENEVSEKTLLYEYEYVSYGNSSPFESLGERIKEGSMAAVYKGRLKSGDDVAVKVRHPFIERELDDDIRLLKSVVDFVNSRSGDYEVHLPSNLSEIVHEHMLEEISFEKETQNTLALAESLSKSRNGVPFFVPAVRSKVSNGNFLVMDYCEGVPLNSPEIPVENQKAYRNAVGLEILDSIIAGKSYQADPNFGNFFAPAGEKIGPVGWIDRGNVRKLSGSDLANLRGIISGIMEEDNNLIVNSLFGILDSTHTRTNGRTKGLIQKWVETEMTNEFDIKDVINSFNEFCSRNRLVMTNEFVHLLKALGLVEPLIIDVDKLDLLNVIAKYL